MARDARTVAPADIRELVDEFLEGQLSQNTRAGYASDLAPFFVWLTERDLHPLAARRADIDRYRNHLSETVDEHGKPSPSGRPRLANATIGRRLAAVRSFYAYAVTEGRLAGSPAVGVKTPKVNSEPQGKALPLEAVRRLAAAAGTVSPDALAIVLLMGFAGLRVSEVCAAQVDDIIRNPGGGRLLKVKRKGGKDREIPLNHDTEVAVLACVRGRSHGPLVMRPGDRRHRAGTVAPLRAFNRQAVYELLRDVGQAAGLLAASADGEDELDALHPHLLRHSFVTALLDAGASLAEVQDAAGHASPNTTRAYDRKRDEYNRHPSHRLSLGVS